MRWPWDEMMRTVCRAILLLGLLPGALVAAGEAWAHGGSFKNGTPNPGPVVGQPPGPESPPRPPVVTLRPGLRRMLPLHAPYDWGSWWRVNSSVWEGSPRLSLPRVAITPSAASPKASGSLDPDRVRRLLLERGQRRVVLPYLKTLVHPASEAHDTLVAAALMAWARTTTDRALLPVLKHYASSLRTSFSVRMAALRAIGLLRRSGPERPLDGKSLTAIRAFLLSIADGEHPAGIRIGALHALALLAEEPYGEKPPERAGRGLSDALTARLRQPDLGRGHRVALLVTLGMQPREGVSDDALEDLRRVALDGTLRGLTWDEIERGHALLAYVRLHGPNAIRVVQQIVLRARPPSPAPMQAAALTALVEHAAHLEPRERRAAVLWLERALRDQLAGDVKGLAYLALGALVSADARDGSTCAVEGTDACDCLLRMTRRQGEEMGHFAALAVAMATRTTKPTSRPAAVFLSDARKALERRLRHARGTDSEIAPFVVAAGLARLEATRPILMKILTDPLREARLRGHAARALGELGRSDDRTVEALMAATRERIDPCVHQEAVYALARLGVPGAVDELLGQLAGDPTRGAMVTVASSLGSLGDPKAADALVLLARNEQAGLYVRSAAIRALGQIFDPEDPQTQTRLLRRTSFPGSTPTTLKRVLGHP